MLKVTKGYCYDDLLLIPKYSEILSRDNVDLSVDLGKEIKLSIPIVASNMVNVCGSEMAKLLSNLGGLPILHRFCSIEQQVNMLLASNNVEMVGAAIGVQKEDKERAKSLINTGCRVLCVDVAHGHHILCLEMIKWLSTEFKDVLLIGGNVATGLGAKMLHEAGADVIKCGVGGGSLCSTRIETGNGIPSMTALAETFKESKGEDWIEVKNNPPFAGIAWVGPILSHKKRKFKVIADGGIKNSGDCVKSLCFSDAIMLGSLLAGTNEAPGNIVEINGQMMKEYEGSSTHKLRHVEGIKAYVKIKGPAENIINKLLEGIKSGCSYQGVNNLTDLKEDPQFVEISNSGLMESHPHSVIKRG